MGGSTKIETIQPAAPPSPPSATAQLTEYINNYPRLVDLQRQYNPETAGLDYELFKTYAPQYTQTAQDIQSQVYPQTSQLQEQLAGQAMSGMQEGLPTWARDQYLSDFNAGIGMNANAPIGVSERSRGLLSLQKEWQDYYRNLGLSVANRQPLQNTANPTFQNAGAQENVNPYLNYGASTYGSQIAGYGAQLQNTLAYKNSGFNLGGAAAGGGAMGLMAMSNPATAPFALGFGALGAFGGGL